MRGGALLESLIETDEEASILDLKMIPSTGPIFWGGLGLGEDAYLSEEGFREGGGPVFLEAGGFRGGNGEEEFVVLAVGQGGVDIDSLATWNT